MLVQLPIRRRSTASTAAAVALLAVGLLTVSSLPAADVSPSEYQVKAAFLLNFTRFIEWPLAAFESAESPFAICILGGDPFGSNLDQIVEGESVGGRKVAVQRISRMPRPKSCQVVFLNKSQKDVSEILPGLGPGVLTVSEQEGFLRAGGMIAFVLEGRRVGFDISVRAASSASLTVSARLLNVARSVQK